MPALGIVSPGKSLWRLQTFQFPSSPIFQVPALRIRRFVQACSDVPCPEEPQHVHLEDRLQLLQLLVQVGGSPGTPLLHIIS
jgi:hypothetical protein